MAPVALACQDSATLDQLLAETAQLFQDHDRDAADTIIMAFDRGTFTKASPLCSLQLAACSRTSLLASCSIQSASIS